MKIRISIRILKKSKILLQVIRVAFLDIHRCVKIDFVKKAAAVNLKTFWAMKGI